jgi:hypothetical protein
MQLGASRNAALHFALRTRKSSRFSSRASRQNTGVLRRPVWYRSTPVEAVGFELAVPCSDDARDSRIHENKGLLTVLTFN